MVKEIGIRSNEIGIGLLEIDIAMRKQGFVF
jgi:hypothetical protein